MNLRTITTIELSSKCNLSCRYCINRFMKSRANRTPQVMADNVFEAACRVVKETVRRGTQDTINLNGNGESLLDPNVIERVARIKEIVGAIKVQLSTNAILLTPEIATSLKDAGLERLHISVHSAYHVRRAVDFLKTLGLPVTVNPGTVVSSHNWAGQLDKEDCVMNLPAQQCDPLIEGRGYIQAEGEIVPCCYDYRNLGAFGTVFNEDLFEREIMPFALCRACHQNPGGEI